MKRIAAIIIAICIAVTGSFTGIPQVITKGGDLEASAASYPALKKITYKATGNQRNDIVGFAKTQMGYAEGGNNNTYFGAWFGCNYNPWCAMFVSWAASKAGVSASVVPRQATADRSWAKKQGVYYKSRYWGGSYTPKKGDLIYFSWSVRDWADHIGMVTGTGKVDGTTYVYTIEGNKHDKVVQGSYALNNRYILGYASPKYKNGDAPQTKPTTTTTTTEALKKYTLKYRDGLSTTADDEEDAVVAPVTGAFEKDLTLSDKKFKRSGYGYNKWNIYRENKNGKLIYLCRDTATGLTEKWYKKKKIPEDFTQVTVDCGGTLNIKTAVSGTIYASPVWEVGVYSISYRANGGVGTPATQTKKHGEAVTLSTQTPSRDDYEFLGWAKATDATAAEYAAGASYTEDEDLTLYAVWKLIPYKVITLEGINTRSGPGGDYKKVSTLNMGTKVKIVDIKGNWGKMKDGSWIALRYTARMEEDSYMLEYKDGLRATKNESNIIPPMMGTYGKSIVTSARKFTRKGYTYSECRIYYVKNGKSYYYCRNKKVHRKEKWFRKDAVPENYRMKTVVPGEKVKIRNNVADVLNFVPVWEKDVYRVKTIDEVNKRKGPGLNYAIITAIPKGKIVEIVKKKDAWGKLKGGGWIHLSLTKPLSSSSKSSAKSSPAESASAKSSSAKAQSAAESAKAKAKANSDTDTAAPTTAPSSEDTFTVKVTSETGVNARTGPGKEYDVDTSYEKDETLTVGKVSDGWGQLSTGKWIMLKYTQITDGYDVKITASDLNQRSGPGTKYPSEGTISPGTYTVTKINGDWGRISETGYWIYLTYATRL